QGTHVNLRDILRFGSILRLGLCLYPIDTAEFQEVIHVEITEVRLKRVEHFRDRHAECFGPLAVHVGIESGRAHAEGGPYGPDGWILPGLGEELLDDGCELLEVSSAGVLPLQRTPSRRAH